MGGGLPTTFECVWKEQASLRAAGQIAHCTGPPRQRTGDEWGLKSSVYAPRQAVLLWTRGDFFLDTKVTYGLMAMLGRQGRK